MQPRPSPDWISERFGHKIADPYFSVAVFVKVSEQGDQVFLYTHIL